MTLMQSARRGIITDEIRSVAKAEYIDAEKLTALVAKGYVTIPKNVNRDTIPSGIGTLMSTKINANIGTSRDFVDVDAEIEKADMAVKYGANTLMDLSTGGDLDAIRRRILDSVRIPVGTVPTGILTESRIRRRIASRSPPVDKSIKVLAPYFTAISAFSISASTSTKSRDVPILAFILVLISAPIPDGIVSRFTFLGMVTYPFATRAVSFSASIYSAFATERISSVIIPRRALCISVMCVDRKTTVI